jgi:hypothetical protein
LILTRAASSLRPRISLAVVLLSRAYFAIPENAILQMSSDFQVF